MPWKMFMLAVAISLKDGCAPLQPSGCHKTSAIRSCSFGRWDDRDEWGAHTGELGRRSTPTLLSHNGGRAKNVGCIWNLHSMVER